MVGVECAMSATKIIGHIVSETKNSQKCITKSLVPFFNIFHITKKIHDFFFSKTIQQYVSQKYNLYLLQVAFGEKIII